MFLGLPFGDCSVDDEVEGGLDRARLVNNLAAALVFDCAP